MSPFRSIHPYDQSIIAEYPIMDGKTLESRLESSAQGFLAWKKTTMQERSDLLKRVAMRLRADIDNLALLITMEMGKILAESRAEVEKCAMTCDFYAEHGEEYIREETLETHFKPADMRLGTVAYEPLGVIFAIMPWNFPFWQVFRFAAPSLMAGNVALLKHAPNVVGCALAIEKIFVEAALELALPTTIFQTLVVDVDVVESIIAHDAVQGVTLTGSEYAGSSVAALAGKHIKRSVLELGGSDPLIVLADADVERAATVAVQSRMQNAGQSCIASKRFLVESALYDDFVHRCEEKIAALKQGNPLENSTTTAPMARVDLAEKLHAQLQTTQQQGGKLLVGGSREGANMQASLMVDVPQHSPAFNEETFGPMAAVVRVRDADEAVELANLTRYGLGASVWTRDLERATRIAHNINAGAVFVNGLVKSTPQLPFGGINKSGYGRELSYFGMKEFMNVKTVVIYE
ncbi:MAG: NAD-dependent succinate-semialdehyde dehydrogenase [Candidatus Kapabacteria bacterium]|jgi:succinate-semialdehyde dehydrogenase/glutarate-semialdehyde dehydrogenase|nr:NAD-dependent succinate-semialdehyde dehydrogenase [Candidatus Kapabacteria bacterium]